MLGEELAVGGKLEEVALVAQIGGGIVLGARLEDHALLLEALYLLFDREDWLPVVCFGRRRSPAVDLEGRDIFFMKRRCFGFATL